MKKRIRLSYFLGVFLALLLVFCVYKSRSVILSKMLSSTFQAPVSLESVDFFPGQLAIKNITLSNPADAYVPTAFKAREVYVHNPLLNFLKSKVEVEEVVINGIYLNIEFYTQDQLEGNWQTLMANMVEESVSSGRKKQTVIKKLILNDLQVNLLLADGGIHRLSPIEHLELDNISEEEGGALQAISSIIAKKMVYSVLKNEGLNLIIKVPLKVIKKILPFL